MRGSSRAGAGREFTRLLGIAALTGLMLVGCGSKSKSISAATTTTPPNATSTTAPSGPPIKVMVIGVFTTGPLSPGATVPEQKPAAQGAVNAINAAGGVDGHPIQLAFCDTRAEPNGDTNCARQAVSDGDVAIVGAISGESNYLSILQAAHIPDIAPYPIVQEYMNPISYPIYGGTLSTIVGSLDAAADTGAHNVAYPSTDTPTSREVAPTINALFAVARPGVTIHYTWIPVDVGDMTPYVAASVSGNQALDIGLFPNFALKFVQALRQTGSNIPVTSNDITVSSDSIKTLGSAANGITLVGGFFPATYTANPGVAKFVSEVRAVDPTATLDPAGENTWAGFYVLAAAAKGLTTVTGPGLIANLNQITNLDLGILPPLNFSKTGPPTFPRLFNPDVLYSKVTNGQLVPITGQFVNPLKPA
jgi:branched-chain amino acid transport system substrate-binding protein